MGEFSHLGELSLYGMQALWAEQTVRKLIRCKHRTEARWKDALCKCAYGRVGSDEPCTGLRVPREHSITCVPLMIAVITCGGKSHFHQAKCFHPPPSTPPPPRTSLFSSLHHSLSCFCLLFRFWTSLAFVSLHSSLSSHMRIFHPSPLSKTPPRPHPPPIPSLWSAHPSLLLLLLPQGYISLLHGLASSLSPFPFIYINEQKSSFHLPPDEQTLLGEEDSRKEERNTEEHGFS